MRKKVMKSLMIGIALAVLLTVPAFAGEWVKGASWESPNAWSYKEGGNWVQNDIVLESDEGLNTVAYYISPCGTMVTNNYAPNGGWIGEDGTLQFQNNQRVTDAYPKAAVYGWNDGHDYITYSFYYYDDYSDGFSIADVTEHITSDSMENGFDLQYNLVKLGNGCYALCDMGNSTYKLYFTVSEDGSKLYITESDGTTTTYNYLEELIYS